MRKTILPLLIYTAQFFIASPYAGAQGSVRGNVLNHEGASLQGASVLLLQSKDSILVKGAVTSKSGHYQFEQLAPGSYLVHSSFIGYPDVYSKPFSLQNGEDLLMPPMRFAEADKALQGVTVLARKPMFEQKIDRMIINVASSVTNAGSTALDVLMRSPGVTVNQQNNSININGKDGVVVMLNGKMNRMPLDALVQMLAGMSSANIEKIEIITTPPANLDAEGNAGFINIVMKKNMLYGTNGSFAVTAGYGINGGPVYASSINFNHRMARWNIYGDYSFSRMVPNIIGTFYRRVINNKIVENRMTTVRNDFRRNHNARVGIDLEVGSKTVIGVLVSGFSNLYSMDAVNQSRIFSNGILDTMMRIDNPEHHPLENVGVNFNLQHQIKPEERVTINIDRIYYNDANTLNYYNQYFKSNGNFINSDQTKSFKETPIWFWVATADYYKRISKKVDMESGIKTTVSNFVNDVRVEREVQQTWNADPEFTSRHNLNESILAAYASVNLQLGEKTSSKAGLRYEYTNSNLGSETKKNIVDRHYGNFFPNVFLAHTLTETSSLNFSYSRRITRPTFNNMAPFVYFIDPNTFFAGNAAVQPSIANSVKGDYLWKRLIFSLSYTADKNTITNFTPRVNTVTNKQTLVAENQTGNKILSASISLGFTPVKWWTMQNNITANSTRLDAVYNGSPLIIKQLNAAFNTTQTFTLPKDFSLEFTGLYMSGSMFGIYRMKPITSLNFAVQKKLGAKAGNIGLNITDFSGPPRYRFSVDAPEHNLVTTGTMRFSVTTFKLTYTRRFGNGNVKDKRMRTTGSEDEKQRVQSN